MKIVYDSKTGNVKRLVSKLHMPSVRLTPDLIMSEPFVLATFTTGFGQVPESTQKFLNNNHELMRGVVASGNRNWGDIFAKAGDIISIKYHVPYLHRFELSGTSKDIQIIKEKVGELACLI